MKVCGIICEYNPFHNGHLHHIKEARRITNCDCLVVILSGNYVQRGDFSILNKWEKTELALKFDCDLVIELPYFYAVQSAYFFAKYSMHLLKLANVDCFVFGSETNDLNHLESLAQLSITNWMPFLENGNSYAKANELAFGKMYSNDILGVNYLKFKEHLKPYIIQRTNHFFSEELEPIASATAIRNAIKNNRNVDISIPYRHDFVYKSIGSHYPIIKNKLLTLDKKTLNNIFLMDEGMENLMVSAAKHCLDYESFINYCTSKRYTTSKIQRTLVHLLLNTTKQTMDSLPLAPYLRVLGFNDIGRKHLKTLNCIIATNIKLIPEPFRTLEITASYIYYQNLPKFEIDKPIYYPHKSMSK